MKITKKFLFSFMITITICSALFVAKTNAATLWNKQADGLKTIGNDTFDTNGDSAPDVRIIIANFIRFFLGFMGIILLIIIVFAGYKYMNAGGEPKEAENALNRIKNAVVGLIIILSAYGLATFITDNLYKEIITNSNG